MSPNYGGGGHIVFGADPVSVSIGVGFTLSCLHNILWTRGWILTKNSWIIWLGHNKELIRLLWPWPYFQNQSSRKTENSRWEDICCLWKWLQSTLVISTSLISNNRLSRSEILVPVLTWKSKNSNKILWKRGEFAPNEQFLLFSTIFSIYL